MKKVKNLSSIQKSIEKFTKLKKHNERNRQRNNRRYVR